MSEQGEEDIKTDAAVAVLETPKQSFPTVEEIDALKLPEIKTEEEMRNFLTSKEVRFYPKERDISIPEISKNNIADMFGAGNLERVEETLGFLSKYLNGEAIIDQWGNNNEGRTIWRKNFKDEYGELFSKVYDEKHNQARVNLISGVISSLQQLGKYLESSGNEQSRAKAEKILDIYKDLNSKFYGEDKNTGEKVTYAYNEMATDEEKLGVIRHFEDKIKQTFDTIAPADAERIEMKVT